jgi:small subunit ribosomal protein S3
MVIERKFVRDKTREYAVKEFLAKHLERVGFSHIEIQKTPVGFSIIIYSSKPGLIVGRRGLNIRDIQDTLQKEFKLESPVVEVREVENPNLDPQIMAEQISSQLMKFGVARFKAIGHKAIEKMIESGAIGCEVKIGGKVPSTRARFWKFYAGYLPKCGDVAVKEVKKGFKSILLKPGIVGITVKLLPPGIRMPDQVYMREPKTVAAGETKGAAGEVKATIEAPKEPIKEEKKEAKKEKAEKKEAKEKKAEKKEKPEKKELVPEEKKMHEEQKKEKAEKKEEKKSEKIEE